MSSYNQSIPSNESKSPSLIINTLIILISSSIILFAIYKIIFKGKHSTQKSTLMIIGPSQSGKTSFFYFLLGKDSVDTVISMKINKVENFQSKHLKKEYTIIDIPGVGFFKETIINSLEEAKVILFFVDASQKSSIISSCEYLYDILNSDKFSIDTSMIIACNKQDENFCKTKKMVENELCNELENIKKIKQKNNLEDNAQIGTLFQMKIKFNFGMFKNITFVECDRKSQYKGLIDLINKQDD